MMLLVMLSGLILGVVNYKDSERLAIDIIRRNNKAEVENISEYYFDKLILDMEFIVNTWAENPDIVNYSKNDNKRYVRSIPSDFNHVHEKWSGLVQSMDSITWIYYALETDGSILIAPVDKTMLEDYDARSRDWYKGTVECQGQMFWTEPYILMPELLASFYRLYLRLYIKMVS